MIPLFHSAVEKLAAEGNPPALTWLILDAFHTGDERKARDYQQALERSGYRLERIPKPAPADADPALT
jgi:hypothetical protein